MLATYHGYIIVVQFLIDYGAYVNGENLLADKHTDVFILLARYGAMYKK